MALADIEKGIAKRFSHPWLKRIFGHPFTPIILTWLVTSAYMLYAHYDALFTSLNDTDDALRLVEMQRFLDGAGWYDMRIPRMNPPEGLVSHWSRLIDVGLAGLYLFLSLFLSPEKALLWTRALWPLLMLLPAFAGIFLIVRRFVGRAIDKELALLLFLAGILLFQFFPARVDHHNAQAALLMLGWGLVLWADRWPFAAWASGFLIAMDLAIGLEIAPYALGATTVLVVGYVFDPARFVVPLRRHALTLAGSMVIFLLLALPPSRWNETACDALAPNYAFPVALTALLLAALTLFAKHLRTPWLRLAGMAAAGASGLALLIAMDPSCLKGPFAHVDPAVRPIWLDHVKEVQPIYADPWENLTLLVLYLFWPLLMMVIVYRTWRPRFLARDIFRWALIAVALLAVMLGLFSARLAPYALMFFLPLIGISMALMPKVKKHPALVLGLSPLALTLVVSLSTEAIKNATPENASKAASVKEASKKKDKRSCMNIDTVKSLNAAPKGLILTHSDFGPAILALTPHSVVSGPYHRIDKAIIETSRMLTAEADAAYAMIRQRNIDYVLYCLKVQILAPGGKKPGEKALWVRLSKGDVPAWLKPVPLKGEDNPLRLYRVVKRHAAQKGSGASLAQKPPALRQGLH